MMGQVGVGLFFMNVNVYYWKKVSLQIKAHSYNSRRSGNRTLWNEPQLALFILLISFHLTRMLLLMSLFAIL